MRDADAEWISPEDITVGASQGLAQSMTTRIVRDRLRSRTYEVSERKQVGDAESMVNEGIGTGVSSEV